MKYYSILNIYFCIYKKLYVYAKFVALCSIIKIDFKGLIENF